MASKQFREGADKGENKSPKFLEKLRSYQDVINLVIFFGGGAAYIFHNFAQKDEVRFLDCKTTAQINVIDTETKAKFIKDDLISTGTKIETIVRRGWSSLSEQEKRQAEELRIESEMLKQKLQAAGNTHDESVKVLQQGFGAVPKAPIAGLNQITLSTFDEKGIPVIYFDPIILYSLPSALQKFFFLRAEGVFYMSYNRSDGGYRPDRSLSDNPENSVIGNGEGNDDYGTVLGNRSLRDAISPRAQVRGLETNPALARSMDCYAISNLSPNERYEVISFFSATSTSTMSSQFMGLGFNIAEHLGLISSC